jgi:hypothetical protein
VRDIVQRAASLATLSFSLPVIPAGFGDALVAMLEANRHVASLSVRWWDSSEGLACWPRLLDLNCLTHLCITRAANAEETAQAVGRNRTLISLRCSKFSPAALLLDALEHNGMLLTVEAPSIGPQVWNRMSEMLQRNRAMHDRARRAALLLLTIRKFAKSELSRHPRDIVLIISKMVWASRADFVWNYNMQKKPAKKAAKKEAKK